MPDKCPQCTSTTKAGDRCKRTTCKWAPFCAAHKAYRVGPSEIDGAGRGAFAVRDMKKGTTLASYVVATIKQTEAQFRDEHPSGRATHTAKIRSHYYTALGAGNRTQNQVGMLNTAPRGERNNARLLASGRVVTSRGVKKDDELLLSYLSLIHI